MTSSPAPIAKKSVRWRTTRRGYPFPRLGLHISDSRLALVLMLPALVLMLVYVAYPLWSVVTSAFQQWATLNGPGTFVGLDNFAWLLTGGQFLQAFGHSLYYTIGNIVAQTLLGFAIALLLHQSLPGRNIARGAILFPFIVPAVVAALIWGYLLNDLTGVVNYVLISLHIIDQPLGLLSDPGSAMNTVIAISVWKYMPFMIILFLARLQTVPVDLTEAARSDGASPMQVLRFVIIPWMTPVIIVAVMLRTIWSFNEFDIPFLMTQGGPDQSTVMLPVLIRQLLIDNLDLGRAAAVSVVMILLLAISGGVYAYLFRRGERILDE